MKHSQENIQAQSALLRNESEIDTPVKNSLCCAAAGITALISANSEGLIPHEKLRGAALADATLTAQVRPLAQPVVGYTHTSGGPNAVADPNEDLDKAVDAATAKAVKP